VKLSELLQITRKSRKLTLMELVAKTGISYSMLYRILNGELLKPTPDILEKLSEPLRLDYHYLLQKAGYIPLEQASEKSKEFFDIPLINWDYCKHLFPFQESIDAGLSDEHYQVQQEATNTFALIVDTDHACFPFYQEHDLIVCQVKQSYQHLDKVLYWNMRSKEMNFGIYNHFEGDEYIDDIELKHSKQSINCNDSLQELVIGKITHHHIAFEKK